MSADLMRHPSDSVSRFLPIPLTRTPEPPEKLVRIMAGSVTLTGLALGVFVSPWGYAYRLRRRQHSPERVHGILPPGKHLPLAHEDRVS